MPIITAQRLRDLLDEYTRQAGVPVEMLLVGGLALQAYGAEHRETHDVDAEVVGPLQPLLQFFVQHQIPADLTHDFSGWSVIAMPPGYRERATDWIHEAAVRIRLLSPVDFIIAKLRRGIEIDLTDAKYVAERFGVPVPAIREAVSAALAASREDTMLFLFKRQAEDFCARLEGGVDSPGGGSQS